MSKPTRYREIDVSGSPRELGRKIGEAARDEVRGFCDIALQRVNKTVPISRDKAMDVARRSGEFAERYRPDLMEELRGTAESAGVSVDELMLLQVRNQLQPEHDAGCTALSLAPRQHVRSGPIVAQNWDNDPALDAFTVVLTRRPEGKPATMTCTQAGLISYLGFSETGIGACVNTLLAPSREVGVPHYFTLRELYEATALEQVAHAVRRAQRAIPVNIMLTTPDGPADLEVTIDDVYILRPGGSLCLTHTNHYVHAELVPINDTYPELAQSQARKQRIDRLVSVRGAEADLETIQAMLRDHDDHPTSICRHANDDPIHGFWVTVFAIVIEPAERRMHVSRGTPCDHPFETYSLE